MRTDSQEQRKAGFRPPPWWEILRLTGLHSTFNIEFFDEGIPKNRRDTSLTENEIQDGSLHGAFMTVDRTWRKSVF